jgi:hypothetical protein
LKRAVRRPPRCRSPVGLGAIRTRTGGEGGSEDEEEEDEVEKDKEAAVLEKVFTVQAGAVLEASKTVVLGETLRTNIARLSDRRESDVTDFLCQLV